MKRDFDAIAKETFDLIVIGGGIIGTGIARDAAMRGVKTLLIEKEDFAYGTASRSSRLIHGGLRYLQLLEFHLVQQDLGEREVLLKIAPHLVHPFPFIIPLTSLYYRVALSIGVRLYDLMASGKSMPSHQHLSRREAIDMEPELGELKNLAGALLYYDCQAPFTERLCIENVLSALEEGAFAANHACVVGFLRDGNDVCGVKVQDALSGERYQVKSRLVVNAAGHWVDCVRDLLRGGPASFVRRTKGVHLLTPKLANKALVLFSPTDNRLFFVMPWLDYTLIGTTDTDYSGDLDAVYADEQDVAYLLHGAGQVFPRLKSEDVLYTFAGLRPLAHIGGEKPSQVTREHKILDHKGRDGIEGLVSVLGGKITAYRAVAREAVDVVCRKLGMKARCRTAEALLPGAPGGVAKGTGSGSTGERASDGNGGLPGCRLRFAVLRSSGSGAPRQAQQTSSLSPLPGHPGASGACCQRGRRANGERLLIAPQRRRPGLMPGAGCRRYGGPGDRALIGVKQGGHAAAG